MAFETNYIESEKIIETRLSGNITNEEILSFIEAMVRITKEKNTHQWIVDYTNARYKLSTLEIFELPKQASRIMDALGNEKFKIKRAIIRIQDISDFSFLEDVASNSGQNLKVFAERNQAIEWLNSIK